MIDVKDYIDQAEKHIEKLKSQNIKEFTEFLNISERDISTGPYFYQIKVRSFKTWDRLTLSTFNKIRDFLSAKELIFETFCSEERGQEPIMVKVVYEDDDEKTLKWLGND